MSMEYCFICDKNIDTDFEEHECFIKRDIKILEEKTIKYVKEHDDMVWKHLTEEDEE